MADPIRAALERLIELNDHPDTECAAWNDAIEAARAALAAAPEATAEESSVPAPAVPALPPGYEAIGPEWQPCVKLPITVHVRQQRPGETHVSTREGITPVRPDDLIMRGVQGEEYPIGRELFNQTYRLGVAEPTPPAEEEVGEAERGDD